MRAAYVEQLGDPSVVTIRDVDVRSIGSGVRVAVRAASVNFPDVLVCAGRYQLKVDPPFIPGSEFAGVVVDSGERVFGSAMVGAFAEEIIVPASSLTPMPDSVDFAAAAAFGVAHRTAYHSLRSVAALQQGDELVVLGAGGGVGLAAVQIGRVLGATVTAVASSAEKLDAARANGAARLINHRDGNLRDALRAALPEGADVVIDPVGGALSEPALRSLRWGGRFVTVGYAAGDIPRIPLNLVLLKGIDIRGFEFRSFATNAPDQRARDDEELLAHFAAGRVAPHIGARFAFDDVVAALQHVADGKAVGKVVLEIA